jgi:hypothetical protein
VGTHGVSKLAVEVDRALIERPDVQTQVPSASCRCPGFGLPHQFPADTSASMGFGNPDRAHASEGERLKERISISFNEQHVDEADDFVVGLRDERRRVGLTDHLGPQALITTGIGRGREDVRPSVVVDRVDLLTDNANGTEIVNRCLSVGNQDASPSACRGREILSASARFGKRLLTIAFGRSRTSR